MRVCLEGMGLHCPGLPDWPSARRVLSGAATLESPQTLDLALPLPAILSGPERRRSAAVTRLALDVAQQACTASDRDPGTLATVFASSLGDGATQAKLLSTLARHPQMVSPMLFHNSVHNATVGYWTLGSRCQAPSTSIAAGQYSFSAGLLRAMMEVITSNRPVLLVAYDIPFPAPLQQLHPLSGPFGVALMLGPVETENRGQQLFLTRHDGPKVPPRLRTRSLEYLQHGNPAAACLPLLETLARKENRDIHLSDGAETHLKIRVEPT